MLTDLAARLESIFAPSAKLPEPLPPDPFTIVAPWFDQAVRDARQPNPAAMILATASADGHPSARVVLCRGIDAPRGMVVFYTNYESRKGEDLASNDRCALVFHWDHADRQVRLEGRAVRSPADESDAYFASRPLRSRVGAWASRQSRPIESRAALLGQIWNAVRELGVDPLAVIADREGTVVPRPPNWGGYRVFAERAEIWLGGTGRIHDRAAWTRPLAPAGPHAFTGGAWSVTRVQP